MSHEFEDPRKELLDDLLQWLEWQVTCGGEVWPVEDIAIWNRRLPKSEPAVRRDLKNPEQRQRPAFLQSKEREKPNMPKAQSGFLSATNQAENHKPEHSIQHTARKSKKPKKALGGALSSFLQARPPSIDFSQLDEKTGLKTVKEHQRQHCSADKACSIGGGRPANPVLVIEGHYLGLTQPAKESLGKIMDHVLNIPRAKMYWLPFPLGNAAGQSQQAQSKCHLCPHLFKASLECLSPQIVLVMGGDMRQKVSMRSTAGQVQMGIEMEIHTNKWKVPALWTHHPTDMVGDVNLKKECLNHLKVFKRMLRKVTL